MTNEITPPPELRQLWAQQAQRMNPRDPIAWQEHIADQAAQWGADQELRACCEWLEKDLDAYELVGLRAVYLDHNLHAARRPKPPTLKEQAKAELDRLIALIPIEGALAVAEPIRRALEALPE